MIEVTGEGMNRVIKKDGAFEIESAVFFYDTERLS